MGEDEIYEGLGLEKPETEPPQEPGDGQEPSQQPETPTGDAQPEDGQEPTQEPEGGEEPPQEPEGGQEPTGQPQSQAGRVAGGVDQAAIDRAYANAYAGKLNPYTGKPILSQADYEAYQRRFQADEETRRREELEAAGLSPETIQKIVDGHPVIQKAQEVIRRAEEERQRAVVNEAKGWYEAQLKQINDLDPTAKVTSLEDLEKRDPACYQVMLDHVRRGMSLLDAYKLTHFDDLSKRRAEAAKRAALNKEAGKAHLRPTGGQGGSAGDVEVPAEVKQRYRDLNPGMTDADIKKEYAKFVKESGI